MSDACVCPMVTPLGKGTIVIHTTVLILFYTEHAQDWFFVLVLFIYCISYMLQYSV